MQSRDEACSEASQAFLSFVDLHPISEAGQINLLRSKEESRRPVNHEKMYKLVILYFAPECPYDSFRNGVFRRKMTCGKSRNENSIVVLPCVGSTESI